MRLLAFLGGLLAFGSAHAAAFDPNDYVYHDLGTIGQNGTVTAINNYGWVTGSFQNGISRNAFVSVPDAARVNLAAGFGPGPSEATSVNDRGVVVGNFRSATTARVFGYTQPAGVFSIFTSNDPSHNSTQVFDINNDGWLAGTVSTSTTGQRSFIRQMPEKGLLRSQIIPGLGQLSRATALNDRREVTGWTTTADGKIVPFRFAAGQGTTLLPSLGGFDAYGLDINEAGTIAGYGRLARGVNRAFTWGQSGVTILEDREGSTENFAVSINEEGWAAGWDFRPSIDNSSPFGFGTQIWSPEDLGGFVPRDVAGEPGRAWIVTELRAINDRRQMAAIAFKLDIETGSFVSRHALRIDPLALTPLPPMGSPPPPPAAIPEPGTWALMILGFAACGVARRRSRAAIA